jgi:hypothetical protein
MVKIRLIGPNAGCLTRRWFQQGKVDWSDGTDLVQLHERPNVRGSTFGFGVICNRQYLTARIESA